MDIKCGITKKKKHHASDLHSSQSSSISPANSLVIPFLVPANSSRNSLLDRIFNSQAAIRRRGRKRPCGGWVFFLRWGNRFDSISSTVQLNDILFQCCNDWFKCSSNPSKTIPAPSNPKPKSNPTWHMHRLFSIYPRWAVRKILEVSVPYSGTREDAEKFLNDTYSRPPPTKMQVVKARSHYDSCNWAAPAADDAREIKLKLGKASTRTQKKTVWNIGTCARYIQTASYYNWPPSTARSGNTAFQIAGGHLVQSQFTRKVIQRISATFGQFPCTPRSTKSFPG